MMKNLLDHCQIQNKILETFQELKKMKIVLLANCVKCPRSMGNAQNEFHNSELSSNYFDLVKIV